MKRYQGKRAFVWGLGLSGKATFEYLRQQGAELFSIDRESDKYKTDPVYASAPLFSENDSIPWKKGDLLIKSPGIPPTHPLFLKAFEEGIQILSEIELGCLHLQGTNKKILAITGSNGKTTTTLLTAHLLREGGKKALAVGNVGESLLAHVDDPLEIYVVELSSFQIEMLKGRYFHAGLILNITPNHLDRYADFSAYVQAKLKLQEHLLDPQQLFVSQQVFTEFSSLFSSFRPQTFFSLQEKIETICSVSYRDGKTFFAPHDGENFGAAAVLCEQVGLPLTAIEQGLATFKKPPHRLEYVCSVRGVHFVNDSKATSVDAVEKAVTALPGKLILIAGGVDKGGEYRNWLPLFKDKVRQVVAIGQAASRIAHELKGEIDVLIVDTLSHAVHRSFTLAQEGETVLLSPGCSSYDQFRDYQERGNHFKEYVTHLEG